MRFLLSILTLLSVVNFSPAASWYVDNAATGANNGTSWANAWQSFSDVNNNAMSAGDTVYISGGETSKTYTGSFTAAPFTVMVNMGKSGTAENPITWTVSTDSGHSGRVYIDAQGLSISFVVYMAYNYLVLDGGPNTNLWIINQSYQSGPESERQGSALYGGIGQGHRVTRVGVSNCVSGLAWNGAYDVEVSSNKLLHIFGDVAISTQTQHTNFGNYRVHHNYIETIIDNSRTPSTRLGGADGMSFMQGCDIYENTFVNNLAAGWTNGLGQHPDALQNSGYLGWERIYNNRIHSFYNSVLEWDTWGTNAREVYFWNNVVSHDNPDIEGASHTLNESTAGYGTISNVWFFNNTFVDFNTPSYADGMWWVKGSEAAHPVLTNVGWLNNLYYDCGNRDGGENASVIYIGNYVNTNFTTDDILFSHNLFWAGYRGTTNIIGSGGLAFTNVSGVYSQPTFVSYATNTPSNNLRLTTGSAGIGAGTNLTAFMEANGLATTDYDGAARPAVGAWEIGAFEYIGTREGEPAGTTATAGTVNAGSVVIR